MKVDASMNEALNGVVIASQRIADQLRIPMGARAAWAVAFPRPEFGRKTS